jgi:probable O-glycosylation ligase (exosortase A-associated)
MQRATVAHLAGPTLSSDHAPNRGGVGRLDGAHLFYLFLTVIAIEYLGLSREIPFLATVRFSTISVYLLLLLVLKHAGTEVFHGYRQNLLLSIFVVFTAATVLWAVITSTAFFALRTHLDYFALFLLTAYLVDRPERVRTFAIVASVIVLVLVLLNLNSLSSGARLAGVHGGYFMGDGNDFAWGLLFLMPLAIFLAVTRQRFVWRALGAAAAFAGIAGVIGTQSRGGTLALAAAMLFYWAFVMKRKVLGVAGLAVVVVAILMLAPSTYFERMSTIQTYQEDNSARARLQVWRAAMRMAIDYPLGVGVDNFGSAYGRYYIPKGDQNTLTWGSGRWLSAHSVYFRLLGEYGVLGVVWIVTLLVSSFRDNTASSRRFAASVAGSAPPPEWPLFLNMSLVGYAAAGTFLGGIAYPHLYLLSGLVASATRQSLWCGQTTAPIPTPVVRPSSALGSRVVVPGASRAPASAILNIAERARLVVSSRPGRR